MHVGSGTGDLAQSGRLERVLRRCKAEHRSAAAVLEGLPRATRVIGNWADVRGACEEFFARHGIGVEARAVEGGGGR